MTQLPLFSRPGATFQVQPLEIDFIRKIKAIFCVVQWGQTQCRSTSKRHQPSQVHVSDGSTSSLTEQLSFTDWTEKLYLKGRHIKKLSFSSFHIWPNLSKPSATPNHRPRGLAILCWMPPSSEGPPDLFFLLHFHFLLFLVESAVS